jgi:hypothetical protein
VNKTTGSNGIGIVYDLPLSIIQNSEAAFNQGGFQLDPNAPYIGPQTTPGQTGIQLLPARAAAEAPGRELDQSGQNRRARRQYRGIEARVQALNILNITNLLPCSERVTRYPDNGPDVLP